MAIAKRKTSSITAEKPQKKTKVVKDSKATETKSATPNKKTIFGKVIEEKNEDDQEEDEDERELEEEPIRDDDEENGMDVDTPDQTVPQKNKLRTSSIIAFVFITLSVTT